MKNINMSMPWVNLRNKINQDITKKTTIQLGNHIWNKLPVTLVDVIPDMFNTKLFKLIYETNRKNIHTNRTI